MINIMQGGHFAKKGYWYRIYMTFPEFKNEKTLSIMRTEHRSTKVNFPTGISLIRNSSYFNMASFILGFGIGLEIHSK